MVNDKDFFGAKKGSVLAGAGGLVALVIGFLWAQSHAPGNIKAALIGGWTLKEGPFYGIMALVLLVGIYGIVNLVRAIISPQKG
jgi:hypothetical protein